MLRVEAALGDAGDDTSVNDIQLMCSDGVTIVSTANGGTVGTWSSSWVNCPAGQRVNGASARFHDFLSGDRTVSCRAGSVHCVPARSLDERSHAWAMRCMQAMPIALPACLLACDPLLVV